MVHARRESISIQNLAMDVSGLVTRVLSSKYGTSQTERVKMGRQTRSIGGRFGLKSRCVQVRHGYALRPDVRALVEALLEDGIEAPGNQLCV